MKKYLLPLCFMLLLITKTHAGEKRINLYGGYVFDDKFNSYYDAYHYFNGKINGGLQFGAGLEFFIPDFNGFELLYIGQQTKAPTYYYPDGYTAEAKKDIDLSFNYALAGFNRFFGKENGKWEGYGGFMLGALFVSATDPDSNITRNDTKFSWGMRLGSNVWMSDNFGIKLQTMLLATTQTTGGYIYFGSGSYGTGSTTPSSMLQFSVSCGIVYRLARKEE